MEPVHSLNRNALLKRLKQHEKYSNLSQKQIGDKLGSIDDLRYELNKLDKKSLKKKSKKSVSKKKVSKKNLSNISNNLPPNIVPDNVEDVMIRSDTKTLQKMCIINKNAYDLCNSKKFWLKKYHYDGYSSFVFNHFDSQGDFEDYVDSYDSLPKYKTYMNNVLMTMQIESKYDLYKNNFIRIPNIDGIMDMYLYFLEEKNNKYYKILEEQNDSHQHLDIKCKEDGFEFYLDNEDVLFFNKLDTIEFLMVYSHLEGNYIYDQEEMYYVEYVKSNDPFDTRRRGIVATLQYMNKI